MNRQELSVEMMNKILLEKVPLKMRMEAVYVPLVVMDCACYLADDLLILLAQARYDGTKKSSRAIREYVQNYRSDNRTVMHSDLYKNLSEFTKGFYNSVCKDITIWGLQYQQELLNRKIYLDTMRSKLVALCCVIQRLASYMLALDRHYSDEIQKLLGHGIIYTIQDNPNAMGIVRETDNLMSALGIVPTAFDKVSANINTAFKVFENKLKQIEFTV